MGNNIVDYKISNDLGAYKIGNDIVDYTILRSESKYLDTRFLKRVFSVDEQSAIQSAHSSTIKDRILWSIWAAKEAAYKACYKHLFPHQSLVFAHNKFCVTPDTLNALFAQQKQAELHCSVNGILNYDNKLNLNLQWHINEDFVHCSAILCLQEREVSWNAIDMRVFKFPNQNELDLENIKSHFRSYELASIFSFESLWTRFSAKQLMISLGFDSEVEIVRFPTTIANTPHLHRLGPPQVCLKRKVIPNSEISLSHDYSWGALIIKKIDLVE